MILCYALLQGDVNGLPAGVEGALPRTVAVAGMTALVSDHERRISPDRDAALAHARVVAAAAEAVPTLPVRLGSWHSGTDHLRVELEEDGPRLRAALERVGGRHEIVVRAPAPPPAAAPPAEVDPADYLRARRDADRRVAEDRAAAAQRLREQTRGLDALACDVREGETARGPERTFLVDRDRRDALLAAARRAAEPEGLIVGGPWPPYTFAATLTAPAGAA